MHPWCRHSLQRVSHHQEGKKFESQQHWGHAAECGGLRPACMACHCTRMDALAATAGPRIICCLHAFVTGRPVGLLHCVYAQRCGWLLQLAMLRLPAPRVHHCLCCLHPGHARPHLSLRPQHAGRSQQHPRAPARARARTQRRLCCVWVCARPRVGAGGPAAACRNQTAQSVCVRVLVCWLLAAGTWRRGSVESIVLRGVGPLLANRVLSTDAAASARMQQRGG